LGGDQALPGKTRSDTPAFLRISSQGNRGSGLSSELEEWIDLSQPDFRPVFSFHPQGHEDRLGSGINRDIHATASPRIVGGIETISVQLEIGYSVLDTNVDRANYRATYERKPRQKDFTLRDVKSGLVGSSTIPNKEFEQLVDLDSGPTNEQLLIYAMPGLKTLASGRNEEAKDELSRVLAQCKDTLEKRALLDLLTKP